MTSPTIVLLLGQISWAPIRPAMRQANLATCQPSHFWPRIQLEVGHSEIWPVRDNFVCAEARVSCCDVPGPARYFEGGLTLYSTCRISTNIPPCCLPARSPPPPPSPSLSGCMYIEIRTVLRYSSPFCALNGPPSQAHHLPDIHCEAPQSPDLGRSLPFESCPIDPDPTPG